MSPPSYARPTVSTLLKHNSPQGPSLESKLLTRHRHESRAFKASFGIANNCKPPENYARALLLTRLIITVSIAALAKMRKKCTTCERKLPFAQFPKPPKDSMCAHDRETCRRCWHQWLAAQVSTKRFDQVMCAQCDNVLGQREIKALATPAVVERYLDASLKTTLSALPEFRWCIGMGCKSGQIHSEGDIFRCVQCQHAACVHCNVAWHESETCEAYQARLVQQPKDEVESAKEVGKVAKLCPGCGSKLQKNGGCDHMTCQVCRYHFCWLCLAEHQAIFNQGNHMHKQSCAHYRPLHPAQPQ